MCKPTLHQTLQALHKTHGVLTIACEPLNANHRHVRIHHSSANHNLLTTMCEYNFLLKA